MQRLASDGPAPEVQWLKWEEKQSHEDYLKMALGQAKEHDSYLAFRRGGGDCIGYVVDGLLHKHRLWERWGVDADCGPATVCSILKEIKWEINNRPSAPVGRSRPWIFHGRPSATTDATSYCYEVEGSEGKQKFLRIAVHHKHRKQDEGNIQNIPGHWWDAERTVSPTFRFSPEVAPTLPDTQILSPTLHP